MTPVKAYPFGLGNIWPSHGPLTKEHLGGKGLGLRNMHKIGLPIPPGFTYTPQDCMRYLEGDGAEFISGLGDSTHFGLLQLEKFISHMPLVSVRSGARVSMPGMADTILNVGITDYNLSSWVERLGERTAYDCYRRFLFMFGTVALKLPASEFNTRVDKEKKSCGVTYDAELNADSLKLLVKEFLTVARIHDKEFPTTVGGQVRDSVLAVFNSWNTPRAIEYRKMHGYSDAWGTAATVQAMVFGNMNEKSATGVVFSRNPSTGRNQITGEYLVNAQGEDVVAGLRTPDSINPGMQQWNPELYLELCGYVNLLEKEGRDLRDIEFTVQDGKLYILQDRAGKRTPEAAIRIAVDMYTQGRITVEEARTRVTPKQALESVKDKIDPSFTTPPYITGIAAGGGIVTGVVVLNSDDALKCNEPCILVSKETTPDDIVGINASVGILTSTGGMTSHAAVVARAMNKSCVVGATTLKVSNGNASVHNTTTGYTSAIKGTRISIDGSTGNVWINPVPIIAGGKSDALREFLKLHHLEGTAERITPHASDTMEELLRLSDDVKTPSIYIDTALIGHPIGAEAPLVFWQWLTYLPHERIIIDVSTLEDHCEGPDHVYGFMAGGCGHYRNPDIVIAANIQFILGMLPEEVISKVVVAVPNSIKAGHKENFYKEHVVEPLSTKGIPLLTPVSTVAEMLQCKDAFLMEQQAEYTAFGGPDITKKIMNALDIPLTSLIRAGYWYTMIERGTK